jgi:hypothetical protein
MRQAGGKGGGVRRTYHIDQYVKGSMIPFLDQFGGVVVGPLGLVVQVPGESLLAPGAFAGVGDGGVGGDGFVFPGVLEELQFHIVISPTPFLQDSWAALTKVKAPCPPMLCPKMLTLSLSTCLKFSKTVLGSSVVM